MDSNLENIQTIRHLIDAERYEEAYTLLKQTNHPQVPALEKKLRAQLETSGAFGTAAVVIPAIYCKVLVGTVLGGILTGLLYRIGIDQTPSLLACFIIGVAIGMTFTPAYKISPVYLTYSKNKYKRRW